MKEIDDAKIDLIREATKAMPRIANPEKVTAARIWHCKYRSLAPVADLRNLEELVIATVPDASLEFLRPLAKLRYLSILHLPKITDLDALSDLHELQVLSLRTLPSWDSSRKRTTVATLDPLRALSKLKHLELISVVPEDKSLAAVSGLPALKSLRVSPFARDEEASILAKGVVDWGMPPHSFE